METFFTLLIGFLIILVGSLTGFIIISKFKLKKKERTLSERKLQRELENIEDDINTSPNN